MGQHQGFWARPKTEIAYVSSAKAFSNGASVNSTTITAPSSISENNLLLAWIIREGDNSSDVACSGWTLRAEFGYGNLVATLLYKWATSSEGSDYTFSHTDASYGGMGGAVLNFSGSILRGHVPIYRVSTIHTWTYTGASDFGWNTEEVNVDIEGAMVVALGAGFRDPIGTSLITMFINTTNGYADLFTINPIGGYSSGTGNCVGGGVGYQKFVTPGVALDGGAGDEVAGTGGGIAGDFGAPGLWYHLSTLLMLI